MGCVGGMSNAISNVTNKYTYACDSSTVSTTFPQSQRMGSAAGTSTRGIFTVSNQSTNTNAGSQSAARNKWTYACDTISGATAASQASGGGSAAGNCSLGIFNLSCLGGSYTNTRNIYTYSSDTSVAGTNASANKRHSISNFLLPPVTKENINFARS